MWLRRWMPRPSARLRLLCLPFAGGSAAAYRSWPAGMPEFVEVVAAELPGRGERVGEPFAACLTDVLEGVFAELTELAHRPLAVYGHSMGGLLAWEVARLVRQRTNHPPVALLVSACPAPTAPAVSAMASLLESSDNEVRAALAVLGGLPPGALGGRELAEVVLPPLRSDLALLAGHHIVAARPLSCPLRVYGGLADDSVSQADLAAWRRESPAGFRLGHLPGGHFFIRDNEPLYLARLAADLTELSAMTTGTGAVR